MIRFEKQASLELAAMTVLSVLMVKSAGAGDFHVPTTTSAEAQAAAQAIHALDESLGAVVEGDQEDLWIHDTESGDDRPLLTSRFNESSAEISPDDPPDLVVALQAVLAELHVVGPGRLPALLADHVLAQVDQLQARQRVGARRPLLGRDRSEQREPDHSLDADTHYWPTTPP